MKNCFWGHDWSGWEETSRTDLNYSPNFGVNAGKWFTKGFAIIQERKCCRCKLKDIKRTEVGAY
jgi:hypothetical protein